MHKQKATTPARPAPTLRPQGLALLTPQVLRLALHSAGALLNGFWLERPAGVRGVATSTSFHPGFLLRLSLNFGPGAGAALPAGKTWLVLHDHYYCHKEKKDGLFRQPGVALGAAGGRAPGA